jgi:cell division septation protein DedD
MRDLERWKDKVELSLDGRQIFFLFFGSAVAACLIFVLGVLIGKRLEARALALQPAPVEDPLAALDQLGEADDADEGLTFHKALTHDPLKKPEKADKIEKAEKVETPAPAPVAKPQPIASPPAESPPQQLAKLPAPPAESPAPPQIAKSPTPPPAKSPTPPAKPLPAGKPMVVAAPPSAGHFTLQLSAFPEKSDAEEFMKKIQSAGYKPFLIASEIPGKGVFWRVRVGDYLSKQAAVDAKGEFERKQRMIAYVAKL